MQNNLKVARVRQTTYAILYFTYTHPQLSLHVAFGLLIVGFFMEWRIFLGGEY